MKLTCPICTTDLGDHTLRDMLEQPEQEMTCPGCDTKFEVSVALVFDQGDEDSPIRLMLLNDS